MIYLDELNPVSMQIEYGGIGKNGRSGHGGFVSVPTDHCMRSVSAHGPSRLIYDIGGKFGYFRVQAAMSSTGFGGSYADFYVYADGRLVGAAPKVTTGHSPISIEIPLYGAKTLELVVETATPHGCHSVWIDPTLHSSAPSHFLSNLGVVRVPITTTMPRAKRCIGTAVTPGYEKYLAGLLMSIHQYTDLTDTYICIQAVNITDEMRKIADMFGAHLHQCELTEQVTSIDIKNASYALAKFVDADHYLFLDVDMIAQEDLSPLLQGAVFPKQTMFITAQSYRSNTYTLRDAMCGVYNSYSGTEKHLDDLGLTEYEKQRPTAINGGVLAGRKCAFLSLDCLMRGFFPASSRWVEEDGAVLWREEFLVSAALARLGYACNLDIAYNTQLNTVPFVMHDDGLYSMSRRAKIIHFAGSSKELWNDISTQLLGTKMEKFNGH